MGLPRIWLGRGCHGRSGDMSSCARSLEINSASDAVYVERFPCEAESGTTRLFIVRKSTSLSSTPRRIRILLCSLFSWWRGDGLAAVDEHLLFLFDKLYLSGFSWISVAAKKRSQSRLGRSSEIFWRTVDFPDFARSPAYFSRTSCSVVLPSQLTKISK